MKRTFSLQSWTSEGWLAHGWGWAEGNGPAAEALKIAPPDLTRLAKQNNGKFPESHVYTVIRGDSNKPDAHGAKDMPLWGALFAESSAAIPPDAEVHQRISNLTRYVESIQKN